MRRLLRILAASLVVAVLALAAGGCGSSTKTVAETSANGQVTTATVPDIHFAKTKFVLHMGLAFGAFHRYIYKPLKAGAFRSGAPGRVKALAKAVAAIAFAVHELKQANADALSDAHLRPLAQRIDTLLGSFGSLGSGFSGGVADAGKVAAAAGAVSALSSSSGGLGVAVKDIAPTL
jgi:hypothetical protein